MAVLRLRGRRGRKGIEFIWGWTLQDVEENVGGGGRKEKKVKGDFLVHLEEPGAALSAGRVPVGMPMFASSTGHL